MKISPTNSPSPKYPALAAVAIAAMALPACDQQQQVAGSAPAELQPLTITMMDEQGKPVRTIETTHAEWNKQQKTQAPQCTPGEVVLPMHEGESATPPTPGN